MPPTSHGQPSTRPSRARPARDLALVAVFAGVVAALGLVPAVPLPTGVPITAQTLGVMLAGAVLGGRRAFVSMVLFVVLVAAGLPLLAGGRGGLGVLAGPTGGYVIGFPVAALVTGWLTERLSSGGVYRTGRGVAAALVGGVLVEHCFGVAGYVLVTGASPLPLLVFVPGDVLKAVLAALVAGGVHRARPGLLQRSQQRRRAAAAPAR